MLCSVRLNTAGVLTSGFTMALAVRAAQLDRRRALIMFLLVTVAIGLMFLGIKGYEYHLDYRNHLVPVLDFAYEGKHPVNRSSSFLFCIS